MELKRGIQNGRKIERTPSPLFLSQLRQRIHPSIHPSIRHLANTTSIKKLPLQNQISNAIAFIPLLLLLYGERGLGKCALQTKGKKRTPHKIPSLLVLLLIFSFHFITFLNSNTSHLFIIHLSSPPATIHPFISIPHPPPIHCHLPQQTILPCHIFFTWNWKGGKQKESTNLEYQSCKFSLRISFSFLANQFLLNSWISKRYLFWVLCFKIHSNSLLLFHQYVMHPSYAFQVLRFFLV